MVCPESLIGFDTITLTIGKGNELVLGRAIRISE